MTCLDLTYTARSSLTGNVDILGHDNTFTDLDDAADIKHNDAVGL